MTVLSETPRVRCGACDGLTVVEPEAEGFWCAGCGAENTLRECAHCQAPSIVASPYGLPLSGWRCEICERSNSVASGMAPVRPAAGSPLLLNA